MQYSEILRQYYCSVNDFLYTTLSSNVKCIRVWKGLAQHLLFCHIVQRVKSLCRPRKSHCEGVLSQTNQPVVRLYSQVLFVSISL